MTAVAALDFSALLDDDARRETVFVAELWQGDRRLAWQTAFFAATKHLSLADPQIQARLTCEDGLLVIELTARSLARLVECSLDGADVVFSDNYFDLPARMTVCVTAALPAGWDVALARSAFRVRSVYDTYATALSG